VKNSLRISSSPLSGILSGFALLVIASCQSTSTLDTDAIIRATQHIPAHFEHEEVDALVEIFTDTAAILTSPFQQIQGAEEIRSYWSRYINPISMHIQHHGFYPDAATCRQEPRIPEPLRNLITLPTKAVDPDQPTVIQWADWKLTYEAEDGVIREEDQPCLIVWISGPAGWRIQWMAKG